MIPTQKQPPAYVCPPIFPSLALGPVSLGVSQRGEFGADAK